MTEWKKQPGPHTGQHFGCDPCFVIKARGIHIGAEAMPTRKAAVIGQRKHMKTREIDTEAYVRLRKEGLQPKGTIGARKLEMGATTKTELEMGRVAPPSVAKRLDEGRKVLKELKTKGIVPA